jgi:streptogramin lyase
MMRKILGLALGAMLPCVITSAATATSLAQAPTYVQTIGGPGEATMYPSGLDVDPSGNIYIADTGNDQVAKYGTDGSELWRKGIRGPKALTATNTGFIDPRDVAYLNGDLYVADTGNTRVVVLNAATGNPITAWNGFGSILGISAGVDANGNPILLVTQDQKNQVSLCQPDGTCPSVVGAGLGLKAPRDAATDSQGNIYIADYGNNRIVKTTSSGALITTWGKSGTLNGQFKQPYGIAVDGQNNVYVANSNDSRIDKFTANGSFTKSYGSAAGVFTMLRRVAVGSGSSPEVYGADLWGYKVNTFNADGSPAGTLGGTPPPNGVPGQPSQIFNEPSGISQDDLGNIFIIDAVNQRIEDYTTSGSFVKQWGKRAWGTDLSGEAWPRAIAYCSACPNAISGGTGTVWGADTKDNRLVEFDPTTQSPTGKVFTSDPTYGKLYWPRGLSVSGSDMIVADSNNNRVLDINTSTMQARWPATGMSGPSDVTVANGIVYVADTGNHRIVELNANTGAQVTAITSTTLFHSIQGIAVDANGNIWVADTSWNRVIEVSPTGALKAAVGSYGTSQTQFNYPTKLQLANGLLYVADQWNNRIQVFKVHS